MASARPLSLICCGNVLLAVAYLADLWVQMTDSLLSAANDRNAFEFEWWIVAFEFFLVLLAAVELTVRLRPSRFS